MLKVPCMSHTSLSVHKKSGVSNISLSPSSQPKESHFGVIDGALVVGFLGAFIGLVFLLSK